MCTNCLLNTPHPGSVCFLKKQFNLFSVLSVSCTMKIKSMRASISPENVPKLAFRFSANTSVDFVLHHCSPTSLEDGETYVAQKKKQSKVCLPLIFFQMTILLSMGKHCIFPSDLKHHFHSAPNPSLYSNLLWIFYLHLSVSSHTNITCF